MTAIDPVLAGLSYETIEMLRSFKQNAASRK